MQQQTILTQHNNKNDDNGAMIRHAQHERERERVKHADEAGLPSMTLFGRILFGKKSSVILGIVLNVVILWLEFFLYLSRCSLSLKIFGYPS
jgi:hypothetical protein